jgi:glycosyltransferase involved in cell wall biosynthesis
MKPIRILVDSFADEAFLNAQMGNAREIIARLDPDDFHVTMFVLGKPDARMAGRRNTRLIHLPERRQTVRIITEFLLGRHELLFYPKASPATKWYLRVRKKLRDQRVVIGTIESQCNIKDLADLSPDALQLWEETVLRCDRLFSNSRFVQESLKKEYGMDSGIIATGADTAFFTPDWERPKSSRLQVLFVGSLRHRKHPELMVTAAAKFPHADFKIVGEGPVRNEIEAGVANEGLNNVFLTGALGPEELRREYRKADIFFFPSAFEGSPKVIVEAAACGLPVICRDSYVPETVLHGVTGYLAKTDEELYSYLDMLVGDAELRLNLGQAGRQHSLNFDWDAIAQQWSQTFCEIARGRDGRRAA